MADLQRDQWTGEAMVALTEGEVVAVFDLIHQHFGLGRKYEGTVCDSDLRSAMEKIGTVRNAIHDEDEHAMPKFDRPSIVVHWKCEDAADMLGPVRVFVNMAPKRQRSALVAFEASRWVSDKWAMAFADSIGADFEED